MGISLYYHRGLKNPLSLSGMSSDQDHIHHTPAFQHATNAASTCISSRDDGSRLFTRTSAPGIFRKGHEAKHETARPCIRNQKRSQTISYKSTKLATLLMKVMQTSANGKESLGLLSTLYASLTEKCLEERPNRHRESWTAAASGCQRSGAPAVTETDGL